MHLAGAKEMFDFELNCLSFFFFLFENELNCLASVWVHKGVELYTQEAPKNFQIFEILFQCLSCHILPIFTQDFYSFNTKNMHDID